MKRFLLAVLLWAMSAVSWADMSPYACRIYFAGERDVPSEVGAVLSLVPGGAVRQCSISGRSGSETYAVLSPVVRGAFGVCQVTEQRVFRDGQKWTYVPPVDEPYLAGRKVFMMLSDGPCARQDDPRYIVASGVSEGVFVAAVRFWEDILTNGNLDELVGDDTAYLRFSDTFRRFERAMQNRRAGQAAAIRLSRVGLDDPAPERTTAHYAMELNGSPDSWSLIVDFKGGRLRLLDVGQVEY